MLSQSILRLIPLCLGPMTPWRDHPWSGVRLRPGAHLAQGSDADGLFHQPFLAHFWRQIDRPSSRGWSGVYVSNLMGCLHPTDMEGHKDFVSSSGKNAVDSALRSSFVSKPETLSPLISFTLF